MTYRRLFSAVVALSAFAVFPLAPRSAQAWGEVGHKVVARIAWDNLKPATRTKLIAILDAAPTDADLANLRPADVPKDEANRVLFEAAATWPDIVRANKTDQEKTRRTKYHHATWHYYDLFFEQNDATGKVTERTDKKTDAENSIERLGVLTALLSSPTATPGDKAVALAWVEHLVGDTHTPLHNVARITATEQNGDQGGNLVKLEEKPAPGKQYAVNLHSFWDDLPENAFPLAPFESKEARIARVAQAASFSLPKSLFEREGLMQTGQFAQWNREGAEVAETKVYPKIKRNQMPDDAYTQEARNTVLIALAKAGYRLAATLENALADTK